MTVSSNVNRTRFLGSNSAGPFLFGFKFFQNEEIFLIRTNLAGVVTALIEGPDYTLIGAGLDTGGSITLADVLASSGGVQEVLDVVRTLDIVQETAFVNQGAFYPRMHEAAFDKLVMMIQQLNDGLSRAIKLPLNISGDFLLPGAVENTVVGFDADGNLTLFSAFFQTIQLLNLGTAPTANGIDATLNDMNVVLPASGEVIVAKSDNSEHIVTITPSVVGQTVGGFTDSITLSVQGEAVRLVLIGTNWYIN